MTGQKSCGGKSILEMLWDALMEKYGELADSKQQLDRLEGHGVDPDEELLDAHSVLRGECLGLGTAIAVIVNPYRPNVDAVRAECVERWEASR